MEKALNLKGKLIKGRAITIKKSTRNITTNKKRPREADLDIEQETSIDNFEVKKNNYNKKRDVNIKESQITRNNIRKKEIKNDNMNLSLNEEKIENKNNDFMPHETNGTYNKQIKKTMKNDDFRKFLK